MAVLPAVSALWALARGGLHDGAAVRREAALPRRDNVLVAHRAEVIHGIAEQRVLVAVEVCVTSVG